MPPRNYIRVLPDLYDRKVLGVQGRHGRYSATAFAAFIGVLCLAEQQPTRGVFASEKLLRVLLEGPHNEGRAVARQIGYLIERGDLVRGPAGSLLVDGWHELQEGNWTAADRQARYRARQREDVTAVTPATVTPVTPPTVTPVTPRSVTPVTVDTVTPVTPIVPRARATRARPAGGEGEGEGEGEGVREVTASVTPRTTNGAKPHDPKATDRDIATANDESAPEVARRAARRAVERHAPERLGEIGAAP